MRAFLEGFAAETNLSDSEADEQWAAFSRQLSDLERRRIERRGRKAGEIEGRRFARLYPGSSSTEIRGGYGILWLP